MCIVPVISAIILTISQIKILKFYCGTFHTIDDTSSTIKLTERHVAKLMTVLHNYSYKWYPFGLNLGFTPPELNTIVCTLTLLTGAPVSYLQELLSRWVQWPTTDHPLVPTLQAMCEALRSSLVGLGSLADKVEKIMRENAGKYKTQQL